MNKTLALTAIFLLLSAPIVFAQTHCNGNFDCDQDVDADDVTEFLNHFGRNQYNNPCPDCYDSPCPCIPCPYGMIDCSDKCVDPMTDRGYCGVTEGCLDGTVCGDGEICNGGMCVLNCQPELTKCGGKSKIRVF